MSSRRECFLLWVIGWLAIYTMACSSKKSTPTVPQESVTIAVIEELTHIDPAESFSRTTAELVANINSGLFRYEADGTVRPGLAAEAPIVSGEGKEWTVALKPDLVAADGSSCDAQCVKDSVERAIRINGRPAFLLEDIDRIEIIDSLRLKFVLSRPNAVFGAVLANPVASPVNPVYPPDEALGFPDDVGPDKLLGLGPYRISSIRYDGTGEDRRYAEVVLRLNKDAHQTATIKEVVLRYFLGATEAIDELEAGTVDLIFEVTSFQLERLQQLPAINLSQRQGLFQAYLGFRCHMPPFDNPIVRQAVAAAIDRGRVIDEWAPQSVSIYSMVPEGMWSHDPSFRDAFGESVDLERAKTLLTQAGYSPANKLSFELYSIKDGSEGLADIVKESLENTGMVEVTIVHAPWPEHVAARSPDDPSQHKAPMFIAGQFPDIPDPDAFLSPFFGDTVGTFFSETTADSLLEQASQAQDLATRTALYVQLQRRLAEQVPMIPLYTSVGLTAARKELAFAKTGIGSLADFASVRWIEEKGVAAD